MFGASSASADASNLYFNFYTRNFIFTLSCLVENLVDSPDIHPSTGTIDINASRENHCFHTDDNHNVNNRKYTSEERFVNGN